MKRFSCALIAIMAALSAVGCAQGQLTPTEDRVLVLTSVASGNAVTDFIQDALLAARQRYTVLAFDPAARANLNTTLWNADGTGRYRAYFIYPDLEATTFTAAEVEALSSYQRRTGARSVKWGVSALAMGYTPVTNCPAAGAMAFTPNAPLGTTGVLISKALNGSGLGGCAGDASKPANCKIWSSASPALPLVSASCTPTPIVVTSSSNPQGVTGALVRYTAPNDTRESMAFTFACAWSFDTCRTLAKVAVNWDVSGGATTLPAPTPPNLVVAHRVLVLTTPGVTTTDFLVKVMDGYGVPYTVFAFNNRTVPKVNMTTLLSGPNGNTPLYSAIILYPDIEFLGQLDRTQIDALWSYQRRTGARMLKFGTWLTSIGFTSIGACSSGTTVAKLTPDAPLGISGVNPQMELPLTGVSRCPAAPLGAVTTDITCLVTGPGYESGLWPGCTPTPILQADGGVIGALVKYADGRESMVFQFDCAAWATECTVLGHLAVTWLVQNIIPGERRPLLSVHADDFFLATQQLTGGTDYRLSLSDLVRHVQWQEGELVQSYSVPGTSIKLELPFNGNGVLEAVQKAGGALSPLDVEDRGCLDLPAFAGCNCWFTSYKSCISPYNPICNQCTKDWPKPAGTGTNRVPAQGTFNSTWSEDELAKDELANMVMTNPNSIMSKFFFSSHTFTHENLDNATSYDVQQQMTLNEALADVLGISDWATYSVDCFVSPEISGLSNGDVLSTLSSLNYACTVGDNTWKHLLNTAKPHSFLATTRAKNGFAGFHIIPRWATEVYYNCTTPEQNVDIYNKLYPTSYGGPSNIDQIMQREAIRVVRDGILSLRKDPHMMHQANLHIDSTGYSLAMRWLRAVLSELKKYVLWPVQSLNLDSLYNLYRLRTQRDKCSPSYTLEVGAGGIIAAIRASSTKGSCNIPLLYSAGTGPAQTANVTVKAGANATFSLAGQLKWSVGPKAL